MKHGYGEIRYKSGLMYKGEYMDNMKHGKGLLLSVDSSEGNHVEYVHDTIIFNWTQYYQIYLK